MKIKQRFNRKELMMTFNQLIEGHRQFQEFLDLATASNNSAINVEPLIEIRQFNIDCISKYSDIIAESSINILPMGIRRGILFQSVEQNELMWQINSQLSSLLPRYNQSLKNRHLNSISRLIIARNMERIIELKDNLLHPISIEMPLTVG